MIRLLSCYIYLLIILLSGSAIASTVNLKKTNSEDQTSLKLTVYNNNIALIKDTRNVILDSGTGELRFTDVASSIIPETVLTRSLNYPDKFSVIEQNYEYDLINADKLLDKYVGKKIKIVEWNKFQDRKESVEALLLSNNDGQIYKIENEIHLGHAGYKILPEIPENLIAKPTLMWMYENSEEKAHNLEISYLTNNIGWKADYVISVNEADTHADLSGWVTLDNQSGATYKDAGLKLVAGKVNMIRPERKVYARTASVMMAENGVQFKEKAFSEYHIYDLQRKTTIKNNQTKQINFLKAFGAEIEKEYVVKGNYSYRRGTTEVIKRPVNTYFKLTNSENNNLGMPLPAGILRVYKNDEDSSLQFIGEDRIDHTPKDETVKIKIGEAFDVVAETINLDYKQISKNLTESEWEVKLRNHKEKDVTVTIIEPQIHRENWKIMSHSHPYEKVDAFTFKYTIKVPKNDEVSIKYRLRVGL